MVDLTPYAIISVTAVTSIFIILFIVVTRLKVVYSKLPMGLAIALATVMALRLLFPIEFLFCSETLLSFDVFPQIDNVIYTDIPVVNNVVPSIKITVVNVFCAVWAIGAAVFVVKCIKEYKNIYKAVKYVIPTNDPLILDTLNQIKREYNYNFDVKVIVNKVISSPSEFGFFRQIIFLDDYKYTAEELNFILSHELTHFYNKSNWINLFMDMVRSILWWNPVIHIFREHIKNLLEIYVDAHVTKYKSHKYRIMYIECINKILKISESKGKIIPQVNFVHSMAAQLDKDVVMKRCNVIRYGHKSNIPICILTVLILSLYIFVSSRYVVQPAYEPDIGDFTHPEFTSENSYIIKEDNMYILYYNGKPYSSNPYLNELPDVPIKN